MVGTIFLFVYALLLVIGLYAFYWSNYIDPIDELMPLFKKLSNKHSALVAFTLGKNAAGQYQNVSFDNEKGNLIRTTSKNPINLDGRLLTFQNDHARIFEHDDGFRIGGINNKFLCPEGYEGPECKLMSLCSDGDAEGTLKHLTNAQFNALQLQDEHQLLLKVPHGNITDANSTFSYASDIHPKIRVRCGKNGTFQLQACGDNMKLNDEVQCVTYDVCKDKVDGFKYGVDESGTYYMCVDGKRVEHQCDSGLVFDNARSGCVRRSQCLDKGTLTIRANANSYIQCQNNKGSLVTCEHGVKESALGVSCRDVPCTPRDLQYHDTHLKYNFGRVVCDDHDQESIQMCDHETEEREWKWGDVSYKMPNWPKTVMNPEGKCVAPTDDIIHNPIIQLQWSKVMKGAHNFNVITGKYVCKDNEYIRDYLRNTTEPKVDEKYILNPIVPCQSKLIPIGKMPIEKFPKNTVFTCYTRNTCLPDYSQLSLWPTFEDGKYRCTECSYKNSKLIVTTSTTSVKPPTGFSPLDPNSSSVNLKYIGQPKDHTVDQTKQYYFIHSGLKDQELIPDLLPAQFDFIEPQDVAIQTSTYDVLTVISTSETSAWFSVNWDKMTKPRNVVMDNLIITIDSNGFVNLEAGSHTLEAGFILFRISRSDSSCTLSIGDRISINVDTSKYHQLQFV